MKFDAPLPFLLAFAVFAASLPGRSARAEDPPPEPATRIYATATVRARPLDSATASVAVIEREEIESSRVASAFEALALVPGLSFLSNGTRGGLAAVQIRGGDPNFTRVLIDGVPVGDGSYQQGEIFNFEALPADAIERIEVVRGPLSAHYGATGLAGAVQLFTRRGEGPPRGELRLEGGDAHAYRTSAALSGGGERGDGFLLAGGEGERERIAEESYRLFHLQGQARRRFGERQELRLAGRVADWDGDDYPEASGGPLFGSGELRRAANSELGASARFAATGSTGGERLFEAAFYRHDLDRSSPAIFPQVPESVEATRFERLRLGGAASRPLNGTMRLSLGADAEREEGDNRSLLLLPPFLGGAVAGDYALARETGGIYGELLVQRERFTFEAGLRADFPEGAADQLSPRLGASYRLPGGETRFHASAGRAFKLPSFFALASPRELGGNPGLEPEKSAGGDLGLAHRFAGGLELDLTLFVQRFENLVDFDFETFWHVNRSRVDSRGAELALDWRRDRLSAGMTATWQEVEDAASGAPLRHRPRWSGGVRIGWRASPRLDLHADLRYASSSVDEQIPVPERREVAGRTLAGVAGSWEFAPRWRGFARVDNVFDERYETLIGFPGAGRSGRLGLAFGLGGR